MIGGATVRTPALQIPPANLTDRQLEDGIAVYERSLAWLRRHFPDVPVTVVYIPSPAASYRHAADEVLAKDFTHRFLHEAGYRLLGAIVAEHLDDRPADRCDDAWPG